MLAGGAINSPAVLLRSGAPDPHGRLGTRTFLHPVVMSSSVFAQKVEAWSGAPQSIYTDHFLDTQAIDGPMGYKLEAPPLHPVIFASTVPGFGQGQHEVSAARRHDEGADAGDLLVRARGHGQRRRRAAWRPGPAEHRHHQESRFIEADQMGAEVPEFFLPGANRAEPTRALGDRRAPWPGAAAAAD